MASLRIETFKATNLTLYAILRNESGQLLTEATPAWDATFTAAEWGTYDIPLTEQVDGANRTGYYSATQALPDTPAGNFTLEIRQRVGGSPALADPRVDIGSFSWYGALGDKPLRALMAFGFGTAGRSGDDIIYKDIWTGSDLFTLTMDPTIKGVRTAIVLA